MAMTHALAGMAAGATLLALAPEYATAAMLAGFVAGLVPDLDVYAAHRRTLHFPVYGPALAVVAVGVAMAVQSLWTVVFAVSLVAVGVHALMDAAGGGFALRPWATDPDRAVYSHAHGRWIVPRGVVAYDGSPGDLALALALGGGLLAVTDGPLWGLVVVTVALAVGYALVRRWIVDALGRLLERLPEPLLAAVPRRLDELLEE